MKETKPCSTALREKRRSLVSFSLGERIRMRIGRISLAFLLAAVSLSAVSADALGIEAYFEAYSRFDQLVTASLSNKPPDIPRVTMPAVASVIATLSDSEAFLVKPHFELEHLGTLIDMCDKASRATMAYVLFDLKSHVDASAGSAAIASQAAVVMNRNTRAFQPELQLLQPFLVRCLAKQIPFLTEFMSRLKAEELTGIRCAGLQQMRTGALRSFLGAIQSTSEKSLNESYRMAVLRAVAESSAQFASLLPIADRQQIILAVMASPLETIPSDAHDYLQTIFQTMLTDCTGLCKYQDKCARELPPIFTNHG